MRKTLGVVGDVSLAVGLVGLAAPAALGIHAGFLHNVLHLAAGGLALYFSRRGTRQAARAFGALFGGGLLLLGIAGWAFGAPGSPAADIDLIDPRLFRMIPGVLELGRADHVLHLLSGLACLVAGAASRPERPAADRARERETVMRP